MYTKLFDLSKKTIIITGGLGYIGSELVKALSEFGAKCIVFDNTSTQTKSNNEFELMDVDLNDSNSIEKAYDEVMIKYSRIDVLICAAAYGGYAGSGMTHEMSDLDWQKGIDGTLNITFKSIKKVIPHLKNYGGGKIITFGSLYSWIAPDFSIYNENNISPPNYGAGKAAIIQLSRHVASQYATYGITVNTITPGSLPHPKTQKDKDFIDKLAKRNMLERISFPRDLVGTAVFLSSSASDYLTATNINVDGGQLSW